MSVPRAHARTRTILRGSGGCTVNSQQLPLKLLCNCLPKCRKLSRPRLLMREQHRFHTQNVIPPPAAPR
jgi:hypothetical protein